MLILLASASLAGGAKNLKRGYVTEASAVELKIASEMPKNLRLFITLPVAENIFFL